MHDDGTPPRLPRTTAAACCTRPLAKARNRPRPSVDGGDATTAVTAVPPASHARGAADYDDLAVAVDVVAVGGGDDDDGGNWRPRLPLRAGVRTPTTTRLPQPIEVHRRCIRHHHCTARAFLRHRGRDDDTTDPAVYCTRSPTRSFCSIFAISTPSSHLLALLIPLLRLSYNQPRNVGVLTDCHSEPVSFCTL